MDEFNNVKSARFRQWKNKKYLLYFFLLWGGKLGTIALQSILKTNQDNPDLMAIQHSQQWPL